jgi:hypothetical protein
MRINIKTKTPIKDNDIKALYLLREAMKLSSDRMKLANLNFALKEYVVIPK